MPAAPAPAAPVSELPSATQQAPPADAADGRPGSGGMKELGEGELLVEEPPLKRHATHSVLMAAGSGSQRQSQLEKQDGQATRHAPATSSGAASSAATTASQRQQPASTTSTVGMTGKTATRTTTATSAQPAAPATIPSASATASVAAGSSAAASGPASGQIGPVAMQSLAARNTGVTPVVIPGGHPRRPSDVGGSAVSPGGQAATEEAVVGGDGQMQPSPAGRTLVAGAVASTSSPASSPRPRSPRATMSGGGHPVIRPYSSVGGDNMSAANLRAYLDDFRQEVRDLVRGLQADMVRQAVAAEMAHRNDIALLQQENKILWEEVRRLSQQLDTNLRFGLLSQNGAPWQ
ncbi:hypothetical protein Vretifemale_12910 [Volvox reticuliferus]|nr:hypothetical protein Vretifemale_12910 [Volvox reticuliferus]